MKQHDLMVTTNKRQYYEQFLQKFPDVHHLQVKQTHTSSNVPERRAQIPGTDDFCIFTLGGKKTNPEIKFFCIVEGKE